MKKLIFILLACSGLAKADCPLYTFPENHKLDQEVNNVCQQIQNPVGNILNYSSGTFIYVKASTTNFNGVQYTWPSTQGAAGTNLQNNGSGSLSWTSPHVLQVVTATTVNTFSTTSASFQASNLTATITPTSSSSKILILASSAFRIQASAVEASAGLFRGTTNIENTNGGGARIFFNGISDAISNIGLNFVDSPATTSSTVYTVYIKSDGTHTTVLGDGETQSITLIEVQ